MPYSSDKFKGVTHMMMLGTGHLDVFDVIQKWVGKNVPGSEQEGSVSRAPTCATTATTMMTMAMVTATVEAVERN